MKKIITILLSILMVMSLAGCNSNTTAKTSDGIEVIYRTPEEWHERFQLEDYQKNEKLDAIPDNRPSAKCVNGTFVGNTVDGIDVYKGIPYAQSPVGELRFQKAKSVLESDEIFDASHFGVACMQPHGNGELASQFEQTEDCLTLNIWSNPNSTVTDKPVLVYIHGGGFVNGGSVDPLYDGWNFTHYNPDIIVVTINYRAGLMGFVDVSSFEGGKAEEYKTSSNNAFYDQIEALRWVKNNISSFGGDPSNVTVCGESAGGCAVSILCVLDEAKGLFDKAIPMSGAVNLCVEPDRVKSLPKALKEYFSAKSIEDLQAIDYTELADFWRANFSTIYNFPVMDGKGLPKDLFKEWEDGASSDITILQGHTKDEFRYYYTVFNNFKPLYLAVCDAQVNYYKEMGGKKFDSLYEKYKDAIVEAGYPEEEINMCFADDISLAFSNTYQALMHAKNGGKGYSYTFCIPYDSKFDDFELGAAHAVDCSYLFGNFDGVAAKGENNQVDASIRFQKMIANFCKTGDPSVDGLTWPEYNNDTRQKMIIGLEDSEVVENPEKSRIDVELEMFDSFKSKYSPGLGNMIAEIYATQPEMMAEFAKTQPH